MISEMFYNNSMEVIAMELEAIDEVEDPFAELIGMFAGPSEVDHDDIYR